MLLDKYFPTFQTSVAIMTIILKTIQLILSNLLFSMNISIINLSLSTKTNILNDTRELKRVSSTK